MIIADGEEWLEQKQRGELDSGTSYLYKMQDGEYFVYHAVIATGFSPGEAHCIEVVTEEEAGI